MLVGLVVVGGGGEGTDCPMSEERKNSHCSTPLTSSDSGYTGNLKVCIYGYSCGSRSVTVIQSCCSVWPTIL